MTNGQMPSGEMIEAATPSTNEGGTTTIQSVPDDVNIASTSETAQRGMETAQQVQSLGFAEFTAGLINGTFDAVVGATVKQMEAYAKLVADLSKTIEQFQAENVSDAQISQYLAERYPDGQGGTCVRPDYQFQDVLEDPKTGAAKIDANQQLTDVVNALIAETAGLDSGISITGADLKLDPAAKSFTAPQVARIRAAMGRLLATNLYKYLRDMARDGMARIVVTEGEIMSKLTFSISTTTMQQKQKDNYNENLNRTQVGVGGNGFWWRAKASTDNTNLNVNSMNEKSFDSTLMKAEMIGEVKVRFKTESFPPVMPSGSTSV